jgi:formylglycine-generating enzyme required for sulfatase activity
VFRDGAAEQRPAAASILADYAKEQPAVLVDLIVQADDRQFAALLPALEQQRGQAVPLLESELRRKAEPTWNDGSLKSWPTATAEVTKQVEQASGIIAERFALVQALPLEKLTVVTEALRPAGYRPVRVRPWGDGGVRVAVVWRRDGRDWKLQTGLTSAQVQAKQTGMIPADVAGYATRDGDRYALLWRKPGKGEQAVVYAGVARGQHREHTDTLKAGGYIPATLHALEEVEGGVRYSGVWWQGPGPPAGNLRWIDREASYADRILAGGQLLLDVSVSASKRYASVWRDDSRHEAVGLHGLAPELHLARCRELAAAGWRPAGLSLVMGPDDNKTVAASVWHRPFVSEAARETLARRQSGSALTLARLGQFKLVWSLLAHSPYPEARTRLIARLGPNGVPANTLMERLEAEKEVSTRRALILALGEYNGEQLPVDLRQRLVPLLLKWYRDDPDPGIHGAIDWLLRHAREGPVDRPLDWGQAWALEAIDRELTGQPEAPAREGRDWYVNDRGQTLTIIDSREPFLMGSPGNEKGRIAINENLHWQQIGRRYAIGTKPVTVAQWQQFVKERPDMLGNYFTQYSPEPGGPMINVSWYMAAAYCNWLSEKEGIRKDQWCYPEKMEAGMKLVPGYLKRTGYRLPTEAEWEYACRAGAWTSRYYGSAGELLPRYAWYLGTSPERTQPVGQKRPNDLGLFDMHGNVWTWCQESYQGYLPGSKDRPVRDNEDIRNIVGTQSRVLRGAAFVLRATDVRAAVRNNLAPGDSNLSFGLRVARTLP